MRIALIGAGAIGCLFGLRLASSGQDVLLIHHRGGIVAEVRRRGVTVIELSGRTERRFLDIKQTLSERDNPDLVFVTVKSYDTENAVRPLSRLNLRAPVLTLQNGLGNMETLRKYLPVQQVLAGTTTEGAQAAGAGRVIHTGRGTTWIGEVDGSLTKRILSFRNMLRKGGFRTEATRNIRGSIWSKAIVNSAINPISALARVLNGEILRVPELRNISSNVAREGVRVAKARGVELHPSTESKLAHVLKSTSANRSSMLQDIEAGKKTEIRQLNGRLSALGRKSKVPTPYNDLLTALILGAETYGEKNKLPPMFRSRFQTAISPGTSPE